MAGVVSESKCGLTFDFSREVPKDTERQLALRGAMLLQLPQETSMDELKRIAELNRHSPDLFVQAVRDVWGVRAETDEARRELMWEGLQKEAWGRE